MNQGAFHKFDDIIITHGDNDLSSRRALCSHLDMRFRLGRSIDYVVNLVNFFCSDRWEYFLNLDNI